MTQGTDTAQDPSQAEFRIPGAGFRSGTTVNGFKDFCEISLMQCRPDNKAI